MSALAGLRVIELSNERSAYAGKLLADMGADVILVEPPGGDQARRYPPFLDDQAGPDRSLWWWHYHTSKRGIVLDLDGEGDREKLRRLIATADLVLEAEPPGRLADLHLDYEDLKAIRRDLIFISVSPFGRESPNSSVPVTDLTLMASAGPVWSCGYDDHTLPPVRPGEFQAYHTACHFAAMAALTALFHRLRSGKGQFIDVSMHAASNVTTEGATYNWLIAGDTVQRQTGRHAAVAPTPSTQIKCRDGRLVNTGAICQPSEFAFLLACVRGLGIEPRLKETKLLELGAALNVPLLMEKVGSCDSTTAIFEAGRAALQCIAATLTAYEFFTRFQRQGIPVGIIYAPEEAFEDEHFRARGFQVPVNHPELGRTFRYPGAPFRMSASPWAILRRAPQLGEHNEEVLGSP